MNDEALRDLARRAGIAVEWQDYARRPHVVSSDSLRRILDALGLPASTRGDLAASRRLLARRATLADLPPLITATAGRPTRLDVGASEALPARLVPERGAPRDLTLTPARGRLRIPAVAEIGYHRLQLGEREVVLAVAPAQCRTIDDVVPDGRLWGIAAQVYALRSPGDAGIGNAAGIAQLAQAAGARGADALCLTPVHALFFSDRARLAPYSPSSRLFLNPLHAAPAMVFGEDHVAAAIQETSLHDRFARLEAQPLIDYPASADAKFALLRALFDGFIDGAATDGLLGADFAGFRAEGGDLLRQHAVFEALQADRAPGHDWREWPTDLRDPASAAVATYAIAHRRDVLFHEFLQWLTDRSLAAAQRHAREAGMRIGLIADLAVGMDPTGSHAWSRQHDILLGLAIGAPPDLFNPRGQDWGLASFSPRAMETGGFTPFIATLRAVLRNAGGIRIDHAMGLSRLWLVPEGADPAEGAYLAYPLTDLLRLLALESARHNAVVVGEDLGTVPDGFRETLDQNGVHGMRVLWFEREANDTGFKSAEDWDSTALAMTTTHDLPTVAGWWHGTDIAVRAACGRLGPGASAEEEVAARDRDRDALWQRFVSDKVAEGAAPPPDAPQPVVDAALAFVTRTRSPLVVLPMEDLLGLKQQPNVPGTTDEHPNWRHRLLATAATLLQDEATARRLAAAAMQRPRV